MKEGAPELITINNDDYHAEFVGRTEDGRQFFLTTPFIPSYPTPGREFVALYLFDAGGRLLEAKIDDLGPRETLDEERRARIFHQRVAELGDVSYEPIVVAPFRVEKFGTEFGLVARPPEDDDDHWWVTVEPGDYMAFYPPWDSGDYDT